jgi:nucleotide-binding universal stress UspA family protein
MSNKIKGRLSKILVGIDGSESSMDAAGYAIEMAKKEDASNSIEHQPSPIVFVWFSSSPR